LSDKNSNITDQVSFQLKLDEELSMVDDVNITRRFETVSAPLSFIQSKIDKLSAVFEVGYDDLLNSSVTGSEMAADLGVRCPIVDGSMIECPTKRFHDIGHVKTINALVEDYKYNITGTTETLVDISTTAIGEAPEEVQKLLCNMNVSFVADRYYQIRDEVCGPMFGGFAQVSWALWLLGLFLEVAAVLASVLSIRLRGQSRSEMECLGYESNGKAKYCDV